MHSQAHSGVVDHFDAQGVDVTAFTNQIRWLFEKLLGESSAEPATTVQLVARAGFVHRGN